MPPRALIMHCMCLSLKDVPVPLFGGASAPQTLRNADSDRHTVRRLRRNQSCVVFRAPRFRSQRGVTRGSPTWLYSHEVAYDGKQRPLNLTTRHNAYLLSVRSHFSSRLALVVCGSLG